MDLKGQEGIWEPNRKTFWLEVWVWLVVIENPREQSLQTARSQLPLKEKEAWNKPGLWRRLLYMRTEASPIAWALPSGRVPRWPPKPLLAHAHIRQEETWCPKAKQAMSATATSPPLIMAFPRIPPNNFAHILLLRTVSHTVSHNCVTTPSTRKLEKHWFFFNWVW